MFFITCLCLGTLPLQQRAIGGNHFRGGNNAGHVTPTSMNHGFPISLIAAQQQQQQQPPQQQHSPNSMAAIGPRSVLGVQQNQAANQQSLANLQKRSFRSVRKQWMSHNLRATFKNRGMVHFFEGLYTFISEVYTF